MRVAVAPVDGTRAGLRRVLRTFGAPRSVLRFFDNLAAPACHVAVAVSDHKVLGAFAFLLDEGEGCLRTCGTYVVRAARRLGVAAQLWRAVRRRVEPRYRRRWVAPTISRRGTEFVEAMRSEGFKVEEDRRWPVRDASRFDASAFR